MAIFNTSALLSAIRNSVGGVTFSQGPYGPYVRDRVVPTNPNTSRQASIRSAFAAAATAWKSLSSAQREAWTTYAQTVSRTNALGNPITLQGLNAFVAVNTLLQQASQSIRTTGPTVTGQSGGSQYTGTGVDLSQSGGNISCALISDSFDNYLGNVTNLDLMVFTGQSRSPSINYYSGPYRLAGVVSGNTGTPETDFDFNTGYPLIQGQTVRCRFVVLNGVTGQMVTEDVSDITVAA